MLLMEVYECNKNEFKKSFYCFFFLQENTLSTNWKTEQNHTAKCTLMQMKMYVSLTSVVPTEINIPSLSSVQCWHELFISAIAAGTKLFICALFCTLGLLTFVQLEGTEM